MFPLVERSSAGDQWLLIREILSDHEEPSAAAPQPNDRISSLV